MPSDLPERVFATDAERDVWVQGVRDQVRQVRELEALTLQQISLQSGVKEGTLSPWLGGTYAGRNERIAAEMEKWLLSRQARRATLTQARPTPGFLMTRTARDLLTALEAAQHGPDFVTIVGPPGIGKTEAINHHRRTSSNVYVITGEPCASTPNAMISETALAVGIHGYHAPLRASRAITHRLTGTGALLIYDEAQHWGTAAVDQLRRWHDGAEIGVALVGNPLIERVVSGGNRVSEHAQLTSRVGARVRRKGAFKADIDALLDAWKVEGQELRDTLHGIGRRPGALRNVTKALRMAHAMAVGEAAELAQRHVDLAWQQLSPEGVAA